MILCSRQSSFYCRGRFWIKRLALFIPMSTTGRKHFGSSCARALKDSDRQLGKPFSTEKQSGQLLFFDSVLSTWFRKPAEPEYSFPETLLREESRGKAHRASTESCILGATQTKEISRACLRTYLLPARAESLYLPFRNVASSM
jgi:hypothetical protein